MHVCGELNSIHPVLYCSHLLYPANFHKKRGRIIILLYTKLSFNGHNMELLSTAQILSLTSLLYLKKMYFYSSQILNLQINDADLYRFSTLL